jgi:hypothetical protein
MAVVRWPRELQRGLPEHWELPSGLVKRRAEKRAEVLRGDAKEITEYGTADGTYVDETGQSLKFMT